MIWNQQRNYTVFRKPGSLLILGTLTALGGCVHSKATYLANGRPGYAIKCGSFTTSWTACLVRAGKMCHKSGYLVSYSDEVNRELLVECKSGADSPETR